MDEVGLLAIYHGVSSKTIEKCIKQTSQIMKLTEKTIIEALTEEREDYFSRLPDEMLLEILKKLPVRDAVNFCKSSKSHIKLCNDKSLWNYFLMREFRIQASNPKLLYHKFADLVNLPKVSLTNDSLCILNMKHKTIRTMDLESGKTYFFTVPRDIKPGFKILTMVASGNNAVGALTLGGELYMWILPSEGGSKKDSDFYNKQDARDLGIKVAVPTRVYFSKKNIEARKRGDIVDSSDEPKITKIACFGKNVMALSEKGIVYIWGSNLYWSLGWKTSCGSNYPIPFNKKIPLWNEKIVDIVCGGAMGVITDKGNLYVWNKQALWQLRTILKGYNAKAFRMDIPGKVKRAFFGAEYSSVVTDEGKLYMWGKIPEKGLIDEPAYMTHEVQMVGCGEKMVVVLKSDKSLVGWGQSSFIEKRSNTPQSLDFPDPVEYLTSKGLITAIVTTNREIYVWGSNILRDLPIAFD